jgi:Mn2+/Fe2+ NRAMP family transporter
MPFWRRPTAASRATPSAATPDGPPLTGLGALVARFRVHPLARVGPGLITGVADDDPSGIAIYSQSAAQFGLNMLWTMPLAFALMLFWSAIINGVVAVPLTVVILLLVSKRSVMGDCTASRPLIVPGSIATLVMGAAAVLMVLSA